MIATLSGQLQYKYLDRVIVNVQGVGYEVFLSTDGLARLPDVHGETFLHIHTNVREDAIILYGFVEPEEKEMFLILKTVSGVGPKLALGILSGIKVDALSRAIGEKDIKLLCSLQGIGKKTAERLCVDLKEKVTHLQSDAVEITPSEIVASHSSSMADVISALVNLGYSDPVARQALTAVKRRVGDEVFTEMGFEEMLKEALRAVA